MLEVSAFLIYLLTSMKTKLAKAVVFLVVILTLFINVVHLFSVKTYDNIRFGYKSTIEQASDNATVQKACSDFAKSVGNLSFNRDMTKLAFFAILLSLLLVFGIIILEKSKKITLTNKDWKWFRFLILAVFLSVIVFAYAGWVLADDYYLNVCMF